MYVFLCSYVVDRLCLNEARLLQPVIFDSSVNMDRLIVTQIGHICSVKFELIAIESNINLIEWPNTKVVSFLVTLSARNNVVDEK